MNFTILFQLFFELLVLGLKCFKFVFTHVEVMDESPDAISPEHFLNDGGLVIKIRQTLAVDVLSLHFAIALTSIE